MSYEMALLRKEDLSLFYYIKDTVLSDFIEREENIPLVYMPLLSTNTSFVYEALTEMVPKPTDRGRGWLYFDTTSGTVYATIEQKDRVTVYDSDGNIIPDTEYMIDYVDGRIVTSGTVQPGYVDYYWNYVSVVDEWAAIEAADPPVIVLDINDTGKGGYQLGTGVKVIRKVDIHIFASSTAERNDLVDKIYNGLYLKSCPLYGFPKGAPIDYDGTFYDRRNNMNKDQTPFDRTKVQGLVGNMEFDKVTSRHVSLPLVMSRGRNEVVLSDLNAYRSKISFDLVYYTKSILIN